MHTRRQMFLTRLCSVLLSLFLGAGTGTVVADDTEIFFPKEIVQDGVIVRPNLMFLMDTSGSMSDLDSGNTSRLRRMQDALTSVLDSLGANINVGLGRLSGSEGGAILFPAADLDALVKTVDPSQQYVTRLRRTGGGANEAQQGGGSGNASAIILSSGSAAQQKQQILTLGSRGATSTGIVARYVIADVANEAEQYSDNSVDTSSGGTRQSNDFELGRTNDGTPNKTARYFALRFEGVALPEDAVIASARIVFTCATTNTANFNQDITISAQNSATAPGFEPLNNNISSRNTTGAVTWRPGNCTSAGTALASSDVSGLVNSVRGLNGWQNGNPMVFVFNLPNINVARTVRAFQGGTSDLAPRLEITYSSNNNNTRQFGLRFDNVLIPRGVRIRSANIRFTGAPGINPPRTSIPTGGLNVSIGIANNTNIPAFTTAANAVSGLATAQTVTWSVPPMGTAVADVTTPDLSALLNNLTAQSSWCGGQALAFTFKTSDTGGLRAFLSGVNGDNAPMLILNYDQDDAALTDGTSCTLKTIVRQISNGADNAEENLSTGAVLLNNNPLDIGSLNYRNLVGFRFDNIDLPQGSVITSATLELTAQATDSASMSSVIRGENIGNAAPFNTSTRNLSTRRDGASTVTVAWNSMPSWGTTNAVYATPDLSTIVQQIVQRADWSPRNAMVLMIDAPSVAANVTTRRRAYSYAQPARAAKLTINAKVPATQLTVREYLKVLVEDFQANGNTPTPEFMYEAARYWRGEAAYYGKTRGAGTALGSGYTPSAGNRISGSATFTSPPTIVGDPICLTEPSNAICATQYISGNPVYKSPFTDQACSTNAQILLSDGVPNNTDSSAITMIRNDLLGGRACTESGGGACATDIAARLRTVDQSSTIRGDQLVTTFTVGLAGDGDPAFLQRISDAGGGQFYQADSTSDLVSAFNSIIQNVLDIPTTFVAPAVTVDSFNRLTDRNEIYFALFRPQSQVRWEGNFKRYKLGGSSGQPAILDVNNNLAVDSATGFFKEGVRSFWSASADGPDVAAGGILDRFTTNRNVYTYTGGLTAVDAGGATAPTAVSLNTTTNLLRSSNASVTKAMLGETTMSDTERSNILEFSRGIDLFDENGNGSVSDARLSIGDPLHSEPALVTYAASATDPDVTAFFGTNEGGLHAINARTGDEQFAFVPQELLPNLTQYYRNSQITYLTRPYGVDGGITPLIRDSAGKHYTVVPNPIGSTTVTLFVGLRMGGRQYYALDVTDRSQPKLKFVIRGDGTGPFRELGQTWSKPITARIKFNGAIRSVVILGGGYDIKQDSEDIPTADTMGRAVFIVDSATGQRLWWGGITPDASADAPNLNVPQMIYSVPSTPKVVDLDGDGVADRMYVADVGGQVFRFNFNPNNTGAATLATYSLMARLGENSNLGARRFYQSPDVSVIRIPGNADYLTVAIGSGYRGHPLSKLTEDRFYVLKDPDAGVLANTLATQLTANGGPYTNTNLYDATANAVGSGTASTASAAKASLANAKGFYIRLQTTGGTLIGEKVLTDSQTFDNKVLFASYIPEAKTSGRACQASAGVSRFYLFSIIDGQPVQNFDQVGSATELTQTDRYVELAQGGLPPTPAILFPTTIAGALPETPLVCVGAECFDPGFNIQTDKTYWIKRQ